MMSSFDKAFESDLIFEVTFIWICVILFDFNKGFIWTWRLLIRIKKGQLTQILHKPPNFHTIWIVQKWTFPIIIQA